VGDFNEDGHQDLGVANDLSQDVAILLGTGMGTFSEASFYGAGEISRAVAVGDFNEDDHQDLVVANEGSDDVAILLGTGTGSFSDATFFAAGVTPRSVTLGDFNEDGHQDLAVPNVNNVGILLGMGTGIFSDASFYCADYHLRSIAVGDYDEDGHQDLAVANAGSDNVAILLSDIREIDAEIDCTVDTIMQGENLPFDVMITNETDTTISVEVSLWVKLLGGPEVRFYGPRSVDVPGGSGMNRTPSLGVPTDAPLGDYIVTLEVRSSNDEFLDEDSFRVTVVESIAVKVHHREEFIMNDW
jgi:hypothetical protein